MDETEVKKKKNRTLSKILKSKKDEDKSESEMSSKKFRFKCKKYHKNLITEYLKARSASDNSDEEIDEEPARKKKKPNGTLNDPDIKRMRECLEAAGLKEVKDR